MCTIEKKGAVNIRSDAQRRDIFCSDTCRTPFPLFVADGLQWKGEKGWTDYSCEGGKSFGPAMGLSSGCFVGLELIEGGS